MVSGFPVPTLTKLSLDGNNLIILVLKELVSDIPAGDGKTANLFYSVPISIKVAGADNQR
jgi:hypothetical protein